MDAGAEANDLVGQFLAKEKRSCIGQSARAWLAWAASCTTGWSWNVIFPQAAASTDRR